ncbi:MAG: HNH endonuclease [Saprospiraceae bacterium]
MYYKLLLKNSELNAKVDAEVYEWLNSDSWLTEIAFLQNLRLHTSGYVFYQKNWKSRTTGLNRNMTIYLHRLIAERFLPPKKTDEKRLVSFKNGDKRDCRIENLEYRNRAVLSRKRRTSNRTGYLGVYETSNNRFRACISIQGKQIHIGVFDTAEQAALAYNKMSRQYLGEDGALNKIIR